MDWIKWVFDGIGSQIIGIIGGLIIGAVGGGYVGYRIGNKNKIKQKQKGGDNSKQIQIGSINQVNGNEAEKRG